MSSDDDRQVHRALTDVKALKDSQAAKYRVQTGVLGLLLVVLRINGRLQLQTDALIDPERQLFK